MRIYINKATGDAIPGINAEGATATAENPLRVRGGSIIPIELQFVDLVDGVKTPARYPVDTDIQWVLKRVKKYTGDTLLAAASFTRPADEDGFYTSTLNTSGDDVLNALGDNDGDPDNDIDSIATAGELAITKPGDEVPDRTQALAVTVENFYSHAGDAVSYPPSQIVSVSGGISLTRLHAGRYLRASDSGPVTITVSPQADAAWTGSEEITLEQAGTGAITIVAGAGVTINSACDQTSIGQFGIMRLKRVAEDVWTLTAWLSIANQDATPPPSPTASSLVPGADFYGSSETPFLGSPPKWLSVNIGGTVYKIPAFT